jgi:hypothetical protein
MSKPIGFHFGEECFEIQLAKAIYNVLHIFTDEV